jgi:sigma-B regulation protein RsbU (phosphoserine phosphatase)
MQSCREVGGDYFDYFPLDDQTIGFAIADVAGKGIPAALLMSTLRVTFHGEALRSRDPHKVAAQLNQAFCDLVSKGQFISFFYGTYAIGDRCLRYSNAGMEPPILFRRRQGYLESLRKGGPVLGINPDQRYRCGTLKLEAGDHLVCFSDGLTEQTNETGDFFDARRVIETARDNLDLPLEELRETILTAVKDFGGPEQSDDRTIMLLKVYDSR